MRLGSDRPRLLYVVTVPVTADVLLRGQLGFLQRAGFDVSLACAPGPELASVAEREGIAVHPVPLEREIDPKSDARALAALVALMRQIRPTIVNASTAKGGLLGMTAARTVDVPVRVYLLRGLRLETTSGATRRILSVTERIASACAHRVVCVSESLRETYVAGGYAPAHKTKVLGPGASNGIDLDRFTVDRSDEMKRSLGLPEHARVIGFVGRPVRDKGIAELLRALSIVQRSVPSARLVLVGGGFAGDHPDPELARLIAQARGVHTVERVDDLRPYYAMMDVLAFPSHREGFPNVPLEAAAAELPVVGARATGVVDAIVDGATGTIVPIDDADALAQALTAYLCDPERARAHGRAGRARVARLFRSEIVWERWRKEYEDLLAERAP